MKKATPFWCFQFFLFNFLIIIFLKKNLLSFSNVKGYFRDKNAKKYNLTRDDNMWSFNVNF